MIDKKVFEAVKKFAAKYTKPPHVLAVILSGSHHHDKPDKNSDLDVYIVLDKGKFRERGNTFVNGYEVEYFVNPLKQVEKYLKDEANPHVNPCTAHMFSNCQVIYQKGKTLDRLRKTAEKLIKKEHAKLKKTEVEMAKYALDDLRKDLDDVFTRMDDFSIMAVSNQILEQCLETFFRIKRTSRDKPKRLQAQLKKLDKKFEKLYTDAKLEPNINRRIKKLNSLIDYVENLLGGKRSKEWKLKSKTEV